MKTPKPLDYIKKIIPNLPSDWLELTTHRLDIYDESRAKILFLEQFENLFLNDNIQTEALAALPTAYDYIRLGHPLSSILEWAMGKENGISPENVISFQSRTAPVLAILRKNLTDRKNTRIVYEENIPEFFDAEIIEKVYGYSFDLLQNEKNVPIPEFKGSTVFISENTELEKIDIHKNIDFFVNLHSQLGSIVLINKKENESYIPEIQHVRRRETIAMTPENCFVALKLLTKTLTQQPEIKDIEAEKKRVRELIQNITGTNSKTLVASSGLSMQYAIMMGVIDYAQKHHEGKNIKFIVPPNCYGGTNDQARRVGACLDNVEIVDLLVDGKNDMVQSIDTILDKVAQENAVPYIIAEIPTNPRVEVPDLLKLKEVLTKERKTSSGETAIDPVFILDQTFCPNVHFLGEGKTLSSMRALSYASGSKFPSGGKCTAGYCVGNIKTKALLDKIELHLNLCDNEATQQQYEILAEQLPSMNQRIADAYKNTREFVAHISQTLPNAKINFVSDDLAQQGFTPSVFSLDLPTIGATDHERENYKRSLNLKLINAMITKIPKESKFCVSYGQLKGCYWTVPATSTQGTTKEGDKDYIVRVSVSPNLDLELHKKVFSEFVEEHIENPQKS